jgi:hypothetical protein
VPAPAPPTDPIATREPPVVPIAQPTTGGSSAAAIADHPAMREPATVTLRLTVDPPGAVIALDGARVQGTELVVVKDLAAHLLRVTAPGYVQHDALIPFAEDQRLVVRLKRGARSTHGTDPDATHDTDPTGEPPTHDRPPAETDLIESHSPYE